MGLCDVWIGVEWSGSPRALWSLDHRGTAAFGPGVPSKKAAALLAHSAAAELDHFCCAKIGTQTPSPKPPEWASRAKRGLIFFEGTPGPKALHRNAEVRWGALETVGKAGARMAGNRTKLAVESTPGLLNGTLAAQYLVAR